MFDQIFTPQEVADELVSLTGPERVSVLADYSVGRGAILSAGEKLRKARKYVGLDLDSTVVGSLRKEKPHWTVSCTDFLSDYLVRRSMALQYTPPAVVLNPPFSARGGTRRSVRLGDELLKGSPALCFVAASWSVMADDGVLAAVLPEGCLYSAKDKLLRQYLEKGLCISVHATLPLKTFAGHRISTVLVSFKPRHGKAHSKSTFAHEALSRTQWAVGRGGLPVHEFVESRRGLPFVHSTTLTSLQDSSVGRLAQPAGRGVVSGPKVLIPRVGRPAIRQLVVLPHDRTVQLSDCVLWIGARSNRAATTIRDWLVRDHATLMNLYHGTGAKYTTVERLDDYLQKCTQIHRCLITLS